jgi:hypothetical protein
MQSPCLQRVLYVVHREDELAREHIGELLSLLRAVVARAGLLVGVDRDEQGLERTLDSRSPRPRSRNERPCSPLRPRIVEPISVS